MSIRDDYHFEDLRNSAEDLVIDELEKQLSEFLPAYSLTEEAVQDMAAYALNMVKPMYRASLMGRVYASAFSEIYGQEIKQAVRQAIEKITGNSLPQSGEQNK